MVSRQQFRLSPAQPFELGLTVTSHGWFDLEPNEWCPRRQRWSTVLRIGKTLVDVDVRQRPSGLQLSTVAPRPLSEAARKTVKQTIARMLQLDVDLRPFWHECQGSARLQWAARRGAGRLLCGASLFEDWLKILFTTNCSWAATRGMVQRLVQNVGEPSPRGRHAFPTASLCSRQSPDLFTKVVHAGYRAAACQELVRSFAGGQVRERWWRSPASSTDELRSKLLAQRGFGPYAAGQALRLLGRFDDLALDSWCRARWAQQRGRNPKRVSDRTIAREYAAFAPYQGLALWLDLTRDWHVDPAHAPRL